jgi:hypothetical protein
MTKTREVGLLGCSTWLSLVVWIAISLKVGQMGHYRSVSKSIIDP